LAFARPVYRVSEATLCLSEVYPQCITGLGLGLTSLKEQNSDSTFFSLLNANSFFICIAVYGAPNFFVLMKENRSMPLDFQVEALLMSRRNILKQLMHAPRRGRRSLIRDDPLREGADSHLSEMIHFGKADVISNVSDPSFTNFD